MDFPWPHMGYTDWPSSRRRGYKDSPPLGRARITRISLLRGTWVTWIALLCSVGRLRPAHRPADGKRQGQQGNAQPLPVSPSHRTSLFLPLIELPSLSWNSPPLAQVPTAIGNHGSGRRSHNRSPAGEGLSLRRIRAPPMMDHPARLVCPSAASIGRLEDQASGGGENHLRVLRMDGEGRNGQVRHVARQVIPTASSVAAHVQSAEGPG